MKHIELKADTIKIGSEVSKKILEKSEILKDFESCCLSRFASLMGRREVLSGKAKFGIFGDGKELAQVALAHFCKNGDWRSGYYRDQTLMFSLGVASVESFFSQLYADTDKDHDPFSGGRQMNAHFATRFVDDQGVWSSQKDVFNVAADLSPTAGQMARLVGLGYASKYYRTISSKNNHSNNGEEIAYGTIGNASTSEGHFWETINAVGVLQVPVVVCVWDDGYGISVPNKYQTTKDSISEVLKGFQADSEHDGIEIIKVRGWNYVELLEGYAQAEEVARKLHRPVLVHVVEMTQPQGHSTSGSHERYKSESRLEWEKNWDCIEKFKHWILENNIATENDLDRISDQAEQAVEAAKACAWERFQKPLALMQEQAVSKITDALQLCSEEEKDRWVSQLEKVKATSVVSQKALHSLVRKISRSIDNEDAQALINDLNQTLALAGKEKYNSNLFLQSAQPSEEIFPVFSEKSPKVDGREVIQQFFDVTLSQDERVFIIGEDIGKLGGVNLEFDGLQKKHGQHRVTDTGIREATILGQGLGAAFRGLRPIIDIQYLDYLLYCIQGISDDLATLHYRTAGGQIAPVIVRTKGHRLEGIWHTGSPISMVLGSVRGCYLCVPRNSVQAAGMYQTLLNQQNPAIVIEVLNGYRVKETLPDNTGTYTVALGQVDVLAEGSDISIVTYGACVKVAEQAIIELSQIGVSAELIDVQTLLPFDSSRTIISSIMKTGAVLFLDEDVPGGGTAYMMEQTLIKGGGFDWLDSKPGCLSAAENRGAYGSDADYYCKPSTDDVVEECLKILEDSGKFIR